MFTAVQAAKELYHNKHFGIMYFYIFKFPLVYRIIVLASSKTALFLLLANQSIYVNPSFIPYLFINAFKSF